MALKQPVSLVDLSLQAVGSFIANHACLVVEKKHSRSGNANDADNQSSELSIRECAQYYDSIIPPVLHNLVTYHTLQYIKECYVQILQGDYDDVFSIVLRSHVTKFDMSDWPNEMCPMLYMNLSKLKHLKHLCVVRLKNNLSYVLEGIKVMKQLEKFECHYCCIDEIVQVLCDNCPALVSLTVSGHSVTDSSVGHLLKLLNLQELNVSMTRISKLGLRQLLLGLPQLKSFSGFKRFLQVPAILTSLESVDVRCRSQQDVENITLFCPSVRKFVIHAHKSLDLSNVANLEYLTDLYIGRICFYKSKVNIILRKIGHQVTALSLCEMRNISWAVLLNEINASCPTLKYLYINSYLEKSHNVVCSTDNQHVFQNLESVEIRVFYYATSFFIHLLCVCVNIRKISFGHVMELCDEDINKILSCNPLIHLQELYIKEHKLTVSSVYNLLSSCKELRYIGLVFWWNTITKSEMEELRNYVHKNNLNVEFKGIMAMEIPKKHVSVMKQE